MDPRCVEPDDDVGGRLLGAERDQRPGDRRRDDLDPWRDAVQELLDGPFAHDTMNEAIDQHEALIREAAQSTDTPTMYGSFAGAVANTRTTVSALRDRLIEQLAEEP